MSFEKLILILVLAFQILGFFLFYRIKKLQRFQSIGEIGLFLSILSGIVVFCFDQNVFSTEHSGQFYLVELMIILIIEFFVFFVYFLAKRIKH